MKNCEKCGGTGYGSKACSRCDGLGKHDCICGDKAHWCAECRGAGRILCPICAGRGALRGVKRAPSLVGANLTRVRTGEYITRHSTWHSDRKLIRDDVETPRETHPKGDEAVRYNLRKIDLEKAGPEAQKYKEKLLTILRQCGWNTSAAAKRVGLSRASMYRRMHMLSIRVPPGERRRRGASIFDHKIAGVR